LRVAVVGAGVAGLVAARTLGARGVQVVVFDKSASLGGRVESVAIDGFVFDSGASTLAPRGRSLEAAMLGEFIAHPPELIELPVFMHASLRVVSGDPLKHKIERYAYPGGNAVFATMLADGLDVRLGAEVRELSQTKSGYLCQGEEFDYVVLAIPTPEALPLLAQLGELRPLKNVMYRSCLSVLLGFERELPEHGYFALLDPEQRHPLTWLSIESSKCRGRAPSGCTAMVAQLGPQYSKANFESTDDSIVSTTLDYIERLYGKEWDRPAVRRVRRWRYSQPETTALFQRANSGKRNLIIAGDAVAGPRVEYAYESGIWAANAILGAQ
jgi:renalase